MTKTRFESIGLYTPEKELPTTHMGRFLDKNLVRAIKILGIKKRHIRSQTEDSHALSVKAALDCLENSHIKASDLEAVIYTGITRFKDGIKQRYEPAMSLYIKRTIGATSALNFDIANACAGMLTGAYVLDNMIKAGVVRNGMVLSGECITPIFETSARETRDSSDEQFASLTLGDAGAAFILDESTNSAEGIDFIEFSTSAEFAELCIAKPSDLSAGWSMYTQASSLQEATLKRFPSFLKQILHKYGKNLAQDYDYAIPHQTSVGAIKSGSREWRNFFKTRVPESLISVDQYGNTASTSHFLVLYKSLQDRTIDRGARLLFVGLASGITIGFLSATIGRLEIKNGNNHTGNLHKRKQ